MITRPIKRTLRVAFYALGAFGCFHIAHDLWFEETTRLALAFGGFMAVIVGLGAALQAFKATLEAISATLRADKE